MNCGNTNVLRNLDKENENMHTLINNYDKPSWRTGKRAAAWVYRTQLTKSLLT